MDLKNWQEAANWDGGVPWTYEGVNTALLKGIYEELKTLNRLLGCSNFTGIPESLRKIEKNTRKKRPYTRKKK